MRVETTSAHFCWPSRSPPISAHQALQRDMSRQQRGNDGGRDRWEKNNKTNRPMDDDDDDEEMDRALEEFLTADRNTGRDGGVSYQRAVIELFI